EGRLRELHGLRAVHRQGERLHAPGDDSLPGLGSDRRGARTWARPGPWILGPMGHAGLPGPPTDLPSGAGAVPGNQVAPGLLGVPRLGRRPAPGDPGPGPRPSLTTHRMRASIEASPAPSAPAAAVSAAERPHGIEWLLLLGPGLIWGASFLF